MRLIHAALLLALASGGAAAQSSKCTGCHDMDKRKVGPAFREIGARYKGDKSKAGEIVARMKEGKGHPKVTGSDAELKAAVESALSTR
jgi:cytochrome c